MTDQLEKQELLIRSVQHVRKQGRPSMRPREGGGAPYCFYRSPDGLSCAAAPFINDYDSRMDDQASAMAGGWGATFVKNWEERLDPLAAKHYVFVRELQKCHDNAASDPMFIKSFNARIHDLARLEGLIVPPPIAMGARTF